MLHLRLITPADRTDEVVHLIGRTVGTTHLVVLPGCARDPEGDVVMCDVAREAGDELISRLRALGIDRSGAITAESIDLSLSEHADEAEYGGSNPTAPPPRALSFGDTKQTVGSSEQLLLNLGGIILAGTLTLLAQKALWATQRGRLRKPEGA